MSELERVSIVAELDPPIIVRQPALQRVPVVFSSPHSGSVYPSAFLSRTRLAPEVLRKSEDAYVDELFERVVDHGAPMIAARFPRAYLDVNREPYELDPELFAERLPDFANTRSLRVAGGLGTIARIVAESEEIYGERLPLDAAFERINRLYRPYHEHLNGLIDRTRQRFGFVVLIDCHSMPSSGADSAVGMRPHFVIGDRFGTSAAEPVTRALKGALARAGYDVALNRPYAGGYITEHYGAPAAGAHALQLEVNRGLYMHEHSVERHGGFARLQRDIEQALLQLYASLGGVATDRMAAE